MPSLDECLLVLDKFKTGEYDFTSMKPYIKEVLSNPEIKESHPLLYDEYLALSGNDSTNKKDITSIYMDNPLLEVQKDNYQVFIEPNVISYAEAKDTSNNKRFKPQYKKEIKNLLKDALSCYKSDNGYYYIESGNGLIEIKPEDQYKIIKKYYEKLEVAIKKIIPLSLLLPLEPLKGYILSNDNGRCYFMPSIDECLLVLDKF